MVSFVSATLIAIAGILFVVRFAKRRTVGMPLTWGEAVVAATYVFFLLFWCYGVVPTTWLNWAGNELGWRTDKVLVGWHWFFTGKEGLVQYFLPFVVDYEKVRDIIAVGIYGVFLGLHVVMWSVWQRRGETKPVELPTSTYGRPLVKQG